MSRQRLRDRLDRVSTRQRTDHVLALATRYSEASGIPVDDLLAEADRLQRHCRDLGAVTPEQQRCVLAAELGITPERLAAEVARLGQAWA